MSPPSSFRRGAYTPSKAPLSFQHGLSSNCEEEGPAETVKRGQAVKFGLTDLKETLKASDDSSESRGLTELLPLCLEWQAFTSMGNQQGAKPTAESRDTLPNSPRIQIPRKRRRRVERPVNSGALHHNLKMTLGTPRSPSKAKRLTELQMTSSPTFGEWDWEEDGSIFYAPAARRKGATVKDRWDKSASTQELKPVWRVKLPDVASGEFPRSCTKKGPHKKDLPIKSECAFADSDTDLSEYDNELYITQPSPDSTRKTEERTRNTTGKAQITQSASQKRGGKKAEVEGMKSPKWWFEELGKRAAARRVIGKIEEVEGIIRRVSLTSLDWIKEGSGGGDEQQFIPDGCVGEDQLQILQQRRGPEFSSDSPKETNNMGQNEDKPPPVEELRVLCEALTQCLHQALRMEGAKADVEALKEHKQKRNFCEQNPMGSNRRNLPSHPYDFISALPNNSSPSLSVGGGTSPVPSLSLSTVLDVSPRTSSSFEGMSPILSPLLQTSTLCSPGHSHHSLPLNQTDRHEDDCCRSHKERRNSEDRLFSLGAGGCGSATTVTGATEQKDQRNQGKRFEWTSLGLSDSNLMQAYGCTKETEASQDYLLSSGKKYYIKTTVASGSAVILCNQLSVALNYSHKSVLVNAYQLNIIHVILHIFVVYVCACACKRTTA